MPDNQVSSVQWAVPDAEAEKLIPSTGFIRDYMLYLRECTDAPLIYHYGSIVTMLSCATSRADIIWINPKDKSNSHKITTPIWSVLIGTSGAARKSTCMNRVVKMMGRANPEPEALLPSDGSLEGWHNFLCDYPRVMLHRDELSVLFDQARRGYSEGIKNWLMEIHSGLPKRRVTVKDQKQEEARIIERPRLAILGGIPPEVFDRVAVAGDWNSGFLARFALAWGAGAFSLPTPEKQEHRAGAGEMAHAVCFQRQGAHLPRGCGTRYYRCVVL